MKKKALLAAVLVSLAVAVVPAVALADDPTAAVKADLAQLSSDVKAAHDALIADLTTVTSDAQKGDQTATKADVKKLRFDRRSLLAPIRSDRKQLRTDLKAARDANVDPGTLKPLVQAARAQNIAALKDLRQAAHDTRAAVKALIESSKK
jgi:hypothetical protein